MLNWVNAGEGRAWRTRAQNIGFNFQQIMIFWKRMIDCRCDGPVAWHNANGSTCLSASKFWYTITRRSAPDRSHFFMHLWGQNTDLVCKWRRSPKVSKKQSCKIKFHIRIQYSQICSWCSWAPVFNTSISTPSVTQLNHIWLVAHIVPFLR